LLSRPLLQEWSVCRQVLLLNPETSDEARTATRLRGFQISQLVFQAGRHP